MKYFLAIAALGFLIGCGDKDEDTGSDTAEAVDTADSVAEQLKSAGGHGITGALFI